MRVERVGSWRGRKRDKSRESGSWRGRKRESRGEWEVGGEERGMRVERVGSWRGRKRDESRESGKLEGKIEWKLERIEEMSN